MHNRSELRQVYFNAWAKQKAQTPLEGVELQIVEILKHHPEYHAFFSDPANIHTEHPPQDLSANPYLHCGLHIALYDQLQNDLPHGVRDAYHRLILKHQGNAHDAEHAMLTVLADVLWEMQQTSKPPDMEKYLQKLQML